MESSLIPCGACGQVQSALRQTGNGLVELCQSEGLPSSLQPLLATMEDTVEPGRLTTGDLNHWAREQRRDMDRLGKHLREVRGTVQPLADRLAVAEKERDKARSLVQRTQENAKKEMEKYRISECQMERSLWEVHRSEEETARRLQEEHRQLQSSTVTSSFNIERNYACGLVLHAKYVCSR